jgi:hypothetical protein
MGLQLVYQDGSKLLIGSNRTEEIQKILANLKIFGHPKV